MGCRRIFGRIFHLTSNRLSPSTFHTQQTFTMTFTNYIHRWIGITSTMILGFIMMSLITLDFGCNALLLLPRTTTTTTTRLMNMHHNSNRSDNNYCYSRKFTKPEKLPSVFLSKKSTLMLSAMESNHFSDQNSISFEAKLSLLSLVTSKEDKFSHTIDTTTFSMSSSMASSPIESNDIVVPIIVIVALTIGILANGWISRLLSGEQGLGSYLSDGSGYQKSKFQPLKSNDDRAVQGDDPLPWLRLPNLDFVEVAGQKNNNPTRQPPPRAPNQRDTTTMMTSNTKNGTETVTDQNIENNTLALEELELLRLRMQEQLLLGNVGQAEQFKRTLERLMIENNIQFMPETEPFQ